MSTSNYPDWLPNFLKAYDVPQRPSIIMALRRYATGLADPAQAPTYSQVRRVIRQYEAEVGELPGRQPTCLLQHSSREKATAYCLICKQIVSASSSGLCQEARQQRAESRSDTQ